MSWEFQYENTHKTEDGFFVALLYWIRKWYFITWLRVLAQTVVGRELGKVPFWCLCYVCLLSWNASWSRQTPLVSQFFSPLVWSLLVDLISGRRMGAPIGFGGMSLLCCRTSSLSCGLAGQWAWGGSPSPAGPALCVSCYPFPWIWFVTSICTITRNLIRLCACQMI